MCLQQSEQPTFQSESNHHSSSTSTGQDTAPLVSLVVASTVGPEAAPSTGPDKLHLSIGQDTAPLVSPVLASTVGPEAAPSTGPDELHPSIGQDTAPGQRQTNNNTMCAKAFYGKRKATINMDTETRRISKRLRKVPTRYD